MGGRGRGLACLPRRASAGCPWGRTTAWRWSAVRAGPPVRARLLGRRSPLPARSAVSARRLRPRLGCAWRRRCPVHPRPRNLSRADSEELLRAHPRDPSRAHPRNLALRSQVRRPRAVRLRTRRRLEPLRWTRRRRSTARRSSRAVRRARCSGRPRGSVRRRSRCWARPARTAAGRARHRDCRRSSRRRRRWPACSRLWSPARGGPRSTSRGVGEPADAGDARRACRSSRGASRRARRDCLLRCPRVRAAALRCRRRSSCRGGLPRRRFGPIPIRARCGTAARRAGRPVGRPRDSRRPRTCRAVP